MSTSRPVAPTLPRPSPETLRTATARQVLGTLTDSARAMAFWLATLLPLVYAPLVLGDVAATHPSAIVALITLNALVLVVGHGHDP
jgi:hypothetical protein